MSLSLSHLRLKRHLKLILALGCLILILLIYNNLLSVSTFVLLVQQQQQRQRLEEPPLTLEAFLSSRHSGGVGGAGGSSSSGEGQPAAADVAVGDGAAGLGQREAEQQPIASKGNFSFLPIKTAGNWIVLLNHFEICLATQTTIDRLSTINLLASYWRGPIELTIFLRTPSEISVLTAFLKYLTACHDDDAVENWFIDLVSVQIAFTTARFSSEEQSQLLELQNMNWASNSANNVGDEIEFHCSSGGGSNANNGTTAAPGGGGGLKSGEEVLADLMKHHFPDGTDPKFVYPQNHMRNAAKHACSSNFDWVTVLDVDLIPKKNSAPALQQFWNSDEGHNCTKCAFVLPIFELAKPCSYPETKVELLAMAKNKSAVPFHFSFWKPAHIATDYTKWSKTHVKEGGIKISHDSTYALRNPNNPLADKKRHSTYFYEPFYIAHKSIPDYEERFLGFGFTRSTQTFRALVEGWSFKVLTPTFLTHCGIQPKPKESDFKTVPRYQQVLANKKIYNQFIDQVLKEYQKSKNKST